MKNHVIKFEMRYPVEPITGMDFVASLQPVYLKASSDIKVVAVHLSPKEMKNMQLVLKYAQDAVNELLKP